MYITFLLNAFNVISKSDIAPAQPKTEPSEGEAPAVSKKNVRRKVSIPILDLEMEKSEANTGDQTGTGGYLIIRRGCKAKQLRLEVEFLTDVRLLISLSLDGQEPEVLTGQSSPESSLNLQTSHLESRRVRQV